MFISMRRTSGPRSELAFVSRWTAVLCLALTLWSAAAVVVHYHAKSIEASKCNVCMSARSAGPAPVIHYVVPVSFAVFTVAPRPVRIASRLLAFALYIRPPPAA